jgi:hypothetical protein
MGVLDDLGMTADDVREAISSVPYRRNAGSTPNLPEGPLAITEEEIDLALREGRYEEFMLDEFEQYPLQESAAPASAESVELFDAPRAHRRRRTTSDLAAALGIGAA